MLFCSWADVRINDVESVSSGVPCSGKNHAIIGLEDWNTLVKVVPLEIALIPQGALTLRLPDRDQSDFSKFRESHSSLWQ